MAVRILVTCDLPREREAEVAGAISDLLVNLAPELDEHVLYIEGVTADYPEPDFEEEID